MKKEKKNVSQEKIVLYQFEYEPIIDADYTSDPVVPCSVSLLMKNNIDIPMIIGHTENESLLFLLGKLLLLNKIIELFDLILFFFFYRKI